MKVLILSPGHPDLVAGEGPSVAWSLFEGLRARAGVQAVLLASVDRSLPALFKPGAHITAFDARPDEYVFLSHDVDPWWHRNGEPLLVEAYAEFLTLIQPDVVHAHHFATFGLELLTLTRRVLPHCRIVFTLHDFLAICAADGRMIRTMDGSPCDRASPVRCHQCFPSIPPEQFFLRAAHMRAHLSAVDVFTLPAVAMCGAYLRWGLPAEKLVHVANGQQPPAGAGAPPAKRKLRNRFGFFGQLVDAKGVWLLLRAVELLRADGFSAFSLEINGDNLRYASDTRREEVERFIAAEEARPRGDRIVSFNGSYHRALIAEPMARVDWCVVPSVRWENSPVFIPEAFLFGRPVIAADVGGQAELVAHERDGLLFRFADARSLADTLRRAATEPGLWDRLAAGIAPPVTREAMVEGYLALYGAK